MRIETATSAPTTYPNGASTAGAPYENAIGHPFIRLIAEQQRIAELAQSREGAAPAATPTAATEAPPQVRPTPREPVSPMPELHIPVFFETGHTVKLQAILNQQMWADRYNYRLQWMYDIARSNYELNAGRTDLQLTPPEPPIFQTTDPAEIAAEMDRLDPQGAGTSSYARVLQDAGGTGYQPETHGTGKTEEYFQMVSYLMR